MRGAFAIVVLEWWIPDSCFGCAALSWQGFSIAVISGVVAGRCSFFDTDDFEC
ncbi:hypothetical protein JZ751_004509 [Albula glossodonta]|uniref:Uncharacterized protein n=1 Tax=Albula glossodonta TaxID=121402 RepID=A0A8T2NCU4_9TELE|nr:hypothetical protein JZ751_004509 [Albula glossodonta]